MKPIRIFLLLLFLFIFFGLLSFFIPGREVSLSGGVSLNLPSLKSVFAPKKTTYANIDSILWRQRTSADSLVRIPKRKMLRKPDSVSIKLASQPLEYPGGDKTILYPFFRALEESGQNGSEVHIMHYGDSQLEGDRITDYLRMRFQSDFGGSGPGLLPPGEETYRLSLIASVSGGWYRTNLMGTRFKDQGNRPYGPMGSYFRFGHSPEDSVEKNRNTLESWITFTGRGNPAGRAIHYHLCRIFYGNSRLPVRVGFFTADARIKSDTLKPVQGLKEYDLPLIDSPTSLTIRFSGADSPDFYGISLDSPGGISVDNIPIRGSSGLEFTRMDPGVVTAMYKALNVRLLILQFGVNVVPTEASDYTFYGNSLYVQLCQLKKLDPDLSIIVIGVSDASRKNGENYESYPGVEKILAAQKSAAFRAGCAFWDLYTAMGGKNSMPSWVMAKEPLATTDFLHFNYSGARIVGKMFYSALISDYNDFIQTLPQ